MSADWIAACLTIAANAVLIGSGYLLARRHIRRDIDNMHRSQGPRHDPTSCDWCQKRGLA